MSDPDRIVDGHPSALARELLRAAAEERPPQSLLERTLHTSGLGGSAALGVGLSSSASAANAGGASGSASGVWLFAIKSIGLASVTAALATGAALQWSTSAVESSLPRTVPVLRKAAPQLDTPPAAVSAPQTEAQSLNEQPRASAVERFEPKQPPARGPHGDSAAERSLPSVLLREEAALIDQAREAVAGGNGAPALRVLDLHARRFSRPYFLPEALYLRMQALRLAGNPRAARKVAERLLATSPNGPQAASARALLRAEAP